MAPFQHKSLEQLPLGETFPWKHEKKIAVKLNVVNFNVTGFFCEKIKAHWKTKAKLEGEVRTPN